MAYDFFPTKGKEILTQCKKFPASNVAEVIKLHEVLQKKYKIDAPINMDLGSKFQNMKKTKVNISRSLEGAITIREINRLAGIDNLDLKFGNGSSGKRGAENEGNAFEREFTKDLISWWEGEKVSNKNHLEAILDLDKTYNLKESTTLQVKNEGGENTKRPIKFGSRIVLENTKGTGNDVGAGVTDITLIKDGGEKIYLSLKFGPTTTFFNVGVRTILTPDEIENGVITDKNGLKLLNMFGIENDKFCKVFQGAKGGKPGYKGVEVVRYDKTNLKHLMESGVGYGYHIIHKFNNGSVLSKKMTKSAMQKAAKTGRMKLFYGGKTGTGKRINMECESSTYKFSLNIRDTQGKDGKPTRMMCDFKYK
tara:strand:- start:54 stop:1148 length:1095 start_codon:yes stop_codon:yes gene_type:complete